MLDALIAAAARHRGAVLFLALVLIGAGIWAFSTLWVDAFPDLSNVQVEVFTEAPGMSPVEVERLVSYPMEVALTGIPGVETEPGPTAAAGGGAPGDGLGMAGDAIVLVGEFQVADLDIRTAFEIEQAVDAGGAP